MSFSPTPHGSSQAMEQGTPHGSSQAMEQGTVLEKIETTDKEMPKPNNILQGKKINFTNTSTNKSAVIEINDAKGKQNHDAAQHIDIINIVTAFYVGCQLNLRQIAKKGMNVEYKHGKIIMKIKSPKATAFIEASGKIKCFSASSSENAYAASRRFARILQKIGFKTRLCNYKVINVVGKMRVPFSIDIENFYLTCPKETSYEPEIINGLIYRIKNPKATLKIFNSGTILAFSDSICNIQSAIMQINKKIHDHSK